MRKVLPLLLILLSFSAFSQTVEISGRCYYDANGNHIFDGSDSVLANRQLQAYHTGTVYIANTDNAGLYNLSVPLGNYDIQLLGSVATDNYVNLPTIQRDYFSGGTDVIDFAFQKRDSVENITSNINAVNFSKIPSAGSSREYKLFYGYDGFLQSMPVTVTLNFNPMLTLASSSLTPDVSASGKLQWNIANLQRNVFNNRAFDSISLSFNFPAVGDTIASFIFSPKFIPGIAVTLPSNNYSYSDFYQNIEFPAAQPIGATSGVKWLRHFAGTANVYESGNSVDTTQDGQSYFIAGDRSRSHDTTLGRNSVAFIAKLNKDGLSVWEKYLDSIPDIYGFNYISTIKHTVDGGCMVLGNSVINDTSAKYDGGVILAKFDSSGKFNWSKILNGSNYDEAGYDMVVLPDGSCMVTGSTNSNDGDFLNNNADTLKSNVFVTKFSPIGNIIFTKIYGGSKDDYSYRIKQLQNGSFLLLASTSSNNGDVVGAHSHNIYYISGTDTIYNQEAWVMNIDANGAILWSKCFGGSNDSNLWDATDNNGGILLTGFTNSKNGDLPYYPEMGVALWALQISNTGNIVWSKLYKIYKGYQDSNYLTSPVGIYDNNLGVRINKTKDGNFVLGGSIADKYGDIKGKHGGGDFTIVKINTTGDILWQKSIGGTQYDYINDIQVDKIDDLIFVGASSSDNDDLYQHSNPDLQRLMVVGKVGITNIIKGQVFIDNNGNHIKDAGEHYYSQGRIHSVKYSDTIMARIFDGLFLNNVDTGNYVSAYLPANNYYTVYPATHTTNFAGLDLTDSTDFALTPKPGINDIETILLPLSTPRPGSNASYRIITKNVGTAPINNVVIGFKKDNREGFLNASRAYSGIQADSIWWGPFTLNAFDIDTLDVNLTLATQPTLNNGDTLSLRVTANPVINDSSKSNNSSFIKQIARGSFDPNDKTEIHAGTFTTTQYAGGEYLQYLVRFQNTGTDTTFFITVKDTLQSMLNPASIEIISTSHPYTLRMDGNIATWDFKKILLPDSATNKAGSNGFILFKIKPKTGLVAGDEFNNKAAIYFDFNLPVITNPDKTVLGVKAGICPLANATFTAGITGASYLWQVNTGSGFIDLTSTGIYSGVNTATLLLTAPPTSMYGYRYRCVVNGDTNSPENILHFSVRWNGAASTAWENAANWDCGSLPDAQTEVVIPAGVASPLISSNASCYSLRLSPGSIVTVATGFKLSIMGKAN